MKAVWIIDDDHLRGVGFQRGQGVMGSGEGAELDLFSCQRFFKHPADGVEIGRAHV